jgi:hypothetical protein
MQSLSWIMTNDGGLSIIANNKHFTVAKDHQNFTKIKEAIKADDATTVIRLIDIQKQINEYVQQTSKPVDGFKVEIKNGCLYVNDQAVDNELSRRTQLLMTEGLPFEHMVPFLQNVLQNPSYNSQKQLFRFLSNHNLPITVDGHFLAYKGVRDDWTDRHTGKFNNAPGAVNEMPRYCCDDNAGNDCSSGFHAGTREHADSFGSGAGHMILVKINPRDVVSVPNSDTTKLRCCRYEVVAEYGQDLDKPVYNAPSNTNPVPVQPSGWNNAPGSLQGIQPAAPTAGVQAGWVANMLSQIGMPPSVEDHDPDEEEDEEDEDFDSELDDDDEEEGFDSDREEEEDEDEDDLSDLEPAMATPMGEDYVPSGPIPVAELVPLPPAAL